MDREEAIAILQEEIDGNLNLTLREWQERDEQRLFPALRIAIEALSAETPTDQQKHQLSEETPTNVPTDLISRADA